MPPPYPGRCVCGAIRYRLTAEPFTLYACHSTDCQAQSGSAFRLSMPVARAALEILSGEPARAAYTPLDGRTKHAVCCGSCATWLWGEPEPWPAMAILRPSTLDDRTWIEPVAHIWVRSAQPWVHIPTDALVFDGQPDDPQALIRAWRAKHSQG
jgi:hypothetical protein